MTHTGPARETVRDAVALATRAPSVHNTQPWRWTASGGTVDLFADWSRQVSATDPDGRDLVLSCGAALHHLRVAFAALGWATVVHRYPDPGDPAHLATVETRPHEPTEDELTLARAIRRRRTDRRRFGSWPVLPDQLDLLSAAVAREGALAVAVIDPAARFLLAGAIAQAAVVQESNPAYAVEMALWSGRDTAGSDGVLAASTPAAGADSGGFHGRTFPRGTLTQPSGKRYGEQSGHLVIATSSDDPLSRLRAGEATGAALLTATHLGLAACPMSQPLEIADTRRAIQDEVLGGSAVPQLFLRLGWAPSFADPLPVSPRRDVDDVLHLSR